MIKPRTIDEFLDNLKNNWQETSEDCEFYLDNEPGECIQGDFTCEPENCPLLK